MPAREVRPRRREKSEPPDECRSLDITKTTTFVRHMNLSQQSYCEGLSMTYELFIPFLY